MEGCFILISSTKTILPLNLVLVFYSPAAALEGCECLLCCDIYSCDCTQTMEDKIPKLVLIHTKQKWQWETKLALFWEHLVKRKLRSDFKNVL